MSRLMNVLVYTNICLLCLFCVVLFCFFFFKQKTAYEIRLSLVGADLAYRFARSFQHIARHFKGSKHGRLPPVDLTIAAAAAAAGSPRNGKSAFMTAAAAIGHPVCLATVRVSAAVLVVTLITQAYLPFHDAYRNGCVVGCDGTFVTQNIHSFSHNFAAAAATRAAESGKAQVERERHVACAREAPKSAAELARARADVATATANMRRAGQEVARARRCVDFRATRLFFTANDTDTNNTARANASLALAFLEHVDDAEVNMCLGDLTSLNGSENGFGGFANAFALDETSLFDCAVLRPCVSANCAPSSLLTCRLWFMSLLLPISIMVILGLACCFASSSQLARCSNVSRRVMSYTSSAPAAPL
mgnify:FL=1